MTQDEEDARTDRCFLCGGAGYSVVYDTVPYRTVACSSCGLVRVLPLPDEGKRAEINAGTYSTEEYRVRYSKDRSNFDRWFRRKLRLIERYKPEKGRLLDIGCSYGFFVEEALRRGWDACGCEVNRVTGGDCRERLGEMVHVGSLDTLPVGRGFDVITMWDVLEHQPDPAEFLRKAAGRLNPGGIIFIQVPNFGSYISGLKGAAWDWLTPGDHLYFFTAETLSRTAAAAGLRGIYEETWEPTRYFIDSLIGLNGFRGPAAEFYRATVVRLVRFLLFLLFLPFQIRLHRRKKGALLLGAFLKDGNGDAGRPRV